MTIKFPSSRPVRPVPTKPAPIPRCPPRSPIRPGSFDSFEPFKPRGHGGRPSLGDVRTHAIRNDDSFGPRRA